MFIIINVTTILLCYQIFFSKELDLDMQDMLMTLFCMCVCVHVFKKSPLTEYVPRCKVLNNHMKNCANSE